MLEFIAPYPGWMISAAIGAFSGAVGYGIGAAINRENLGKFLGIAGVAVSLALLRFLQPSIDAERSIIIDPSIYPKKIDEVTTWISAERDGKILTFNYDVSVEIPDDSAETIKKSILIQACTNFRPVFAQTRVSSIRYVYGAPNGKFEFSVTPTDCTNAGVPM